MPESVCRLSVQTDGERACEATDLVLPAGAQVDSLLPDIVTLVHPDRTPDAKSWRLDRVSGQPIDGSLSLVQNGVHDGDVLQLRGIAAPVLGPAGQHSAAMAAGPPVPDQLSDVISRVLGLWTLVVAGVMLAWSGTHGDQPTAVAITFGAALFALAATLRADRNAGTSWAVAAIVLAGVAGFSTVPTRPSAPNTLLASAAVLAVALILLRTGRHLVPAAAAALSVPMLVAAGLASCGPIAKESSGPVVAVTALVVLSVAPRCAVAVAGLTTGLESLDDGDRRRIDLAHKLLTGMVIGAAAAGAVGACVVAVGAIHHGGTPTLVFSWTLAAAMLLRVPSYRLPVRRRSALSAGMICTTAALAVTGMSFPGMMSWLGLAVVTVGLAGLRMGPPGATAVRRLAYVEYAALAAMLPSALWVADVYALVRGR